MKNLTLTLALAFGLAAALGARAQDIINTNNTVVRFAFSTGGTNFGQVDLELFDQEKPETVKNFLLYVYSGGYSNLVFHRLNPNFVIQSGFVTVTNPASSNKFISYVPGPNFGTITNEYGVGPELHNSFGTIAMARVGGRTNSADSQFFINLNNNTNLDTADGGFTVFGHVVNTTGPDNGTNLLGFFMSLTNGDGTQIRHIAVASPFQEFLELPVSAAPRTYYVTNGTGTNVTISTNLDYSVLYADLFTANSFVLQNGRNRETNAPTLTLSDATDLVTTNASLEVSGLAGDGTGLNRILIETPYAQIITPGVTNWSTVLQLLPGTNDFTAWSVDIFGNLSAPQKRKVFYLLRTPIHLSADGPGKISGLTNGQVLMAGVNYSMTARPGPGKFFLGWSGDFSASYRNPKITFRMSEDLSVVARFSDTLRGQAKGTYNGMFFPGANGPKSSLGWLTLNFTASGSYYGRLSPLGTSFQTKGKFDMDGISIITGQLGLDTLTLRMDLVGEGTEAILAKYSNGHFLSDGVLFRVQTFKGTNIAASTGRYTYLLYPTADTNVLSGDGYGCGTMVVSSKGKITMSGHLGDGASIKQTTSIMRGERWPLFSQAYLGRGGVMGFGLFSSNHIINTTARWFSPDFPGNTNQVVRFAVSPYTPPSLARLFNWTNGVVRLAGNGLAEPLSANLVLNEDGSFTIPSNPNNIQLDVTDATGLLTGSFIHPVSLALTPLQGAVLQSSNVAAGYFSSGTNNGSVLIRAQ